MWTTHTLLFFYFEYGDYLCNVVFLSGPALEDDVIFPFAFHLCFLSLILMTEERKQEEEEKDTRTRRHQTNGG
jgi:hypothetical protein